MSFESAFYVLDISFCQTVIPKYFLSVCGIPFHSLANIFHRAKILRLMELNLSTFVVMNQAFSIISIIKPLGITQEFCSCFVLQVLQFYILHSGLWFIIF